MNSKKKFYRPRVGMRFQMRGCEFEVCFAEIGLVRYASAKGGNPCRITFDRFHELQQEDEITILNIELHGQDEIGGTPSLTNLTDDESSATMRQLRYAEAAFAELIHPNSLKYLKAWIPNYAELIHDSKPPSARSVSDWVRKFLQHGKSAFMAPKRKCGNHSLQFSPEIEMLTLEAVDTFLQEENRDGNDVLAYIVGHLAEQNLLTKYGSKIKIPNIRTIRRHLNKIDPFLLVRIKKGVVAAEKMARAAGKMITSPRPLYLVQIDTHFLDIFVVDPDTGEVLGTPYLVCAFDVGTRCVVGIFVSLFPASTATTLGVVKDMLTRQGHGLPGGVPVQIIPDNGVEFKNSGVERVLSKLNVIFEPAKVRDPNGKAHVESFFRTLTLFLIQKIKGTTFSNLEKRGTYDSKGKAYATLEQIEGYIRFWIENEYHQRPHSMTGRVPILMWEEETAKSKPLTLEKGEVDAIARRPYQCCINGGRVRAKKLSYFSNALRTLESHYEGKVTVLINELDLDYALVEHPFEKGTLIKADSIEPEYTQGLTMWEHEEAQKLKAQMTAKDVKVIGKYANLLARWQLLQMIQKDSQVARSKIARLTQGKGRINYKNDTDSLDLLDDATIPPSIVEQPYGKPAILEGVDIISDRDAGSDPPPVMQDKKPDEKEATETRSASKIYILE